jgi:4-alpha-glucanotransferase
MPDTRAGQSPFVHTTRSSGILLHPTSLPGGRLGREAYRFVDWLAAAGQSWWQILPLGPPDEHGSPYRPASAFACWEGLLADPDARVSAGDVGDFAARHAYWAADWAAYAGSGALAAQVRFEREWNALREYAGRRGVRLIGDLPIYVAPESADHRSHPELFQQDVVAGVPPDEWSATGQLWGNPLYDWAALRRTGYRWWVERFRRTFELVDVARIDHFRGFVSYWVVPEVSASPLQGRWRRGPGAALFRAVEAELGDLPLVAEDLGLITPAVDRLRAELGILSMRIVGRGFTARHRRRHATAAHPEDAVAYTGTHDHQTIAGWRQTAPAAELARAAGDLAAAGIRDADPVWALVRLALSSRARIAILPLQDLLGLGNGSRMNTPGTIGRANWSWRLERGQLTDELAEKLRNAAAEAGRAERASRGELLRVASIAAPPPPRAATVAAAMATVRLDLRFGMGR